MAASFATVQGGATILPGRSATTAGATVKRPAMQSVSGQAVPERVMQAVAQTVFLDQYVLTPATRIADDLGIGRFGRIRLALYLEESFDMEIPDEAVERFSTLADIIRYMRRWSGETR